MSPETIQEFGRATGLTVEHTTTLLGNRDFLKARALDWADKNKATVAWSHQCFVCLLGEYRGHGKTRLEAIINCAIASHKEKA